MKIHRLIAHVSREVARRPVHTLLLMLCAAAGVVALMTVDGLSAGVERQLHALIADWRGQCNIAAYGRRTTGADGRTCERNTLTKADLTALSLEIHDATFYPFLSMPARVDGPRGHRRMPVSAYGTEYFRLSGWLTAIGDPLSEDDEAESARVCVIGRSFAEQMFGTTGQAIGRTIRINGFPFRVKGVLQRRGADVIGHDHDLAIFIPVSTAQKRVMCVEGLRGIGYSSSSFEKQPEIRRRITAVLRARHRLRSDQDDDFDIIDAGWLRRRYAGSFRTVRLLGMALTLIAAVMAVGVIGNVTILSVQQRRGEIGLKRALGATARAVGIEVLSETLIVSLGGATLGVIFYMIPLAIVPRVTQIAPGFARFPLAFSSWSAITAPGLAAAIGAVSGYLPARRAARLDPADALRQ